MGLFASLRNAVRWAAVDLGRTDGASAQAVVLVNPVTGLSVGEGGTLPTEPLGTPTVARQLTAGSASANTALTATCRRVSIRARNADVRFAIGAGAQTAVATTSHYLAQDERLDFAVPAGAQIAVIRDSLSSVNAVVCLTELA